MTQKRIKKDIKVLHQIELAKSIFSLLKNNKTIYDTQTVMNALAGFIKFELGKKIDLIKVSLVHDEIKAIIKAEKKSEIKTSLENILELVKDEPAKDVIALLETFANKIGEHGQSIYVKKPISELNIKDIIV